jgi:hypothetical protein
MLFLLIFFIKSKYLFFWSFYEIISLIYKYLYEMNIENKDIIENDNSNIRDLLSKNMETQKSEVFSFFEFSENEKDTFNVNAEVLKGFGLNFSKQLL